MSYNPFIEIKPKEIAKLTFMCEFSNYLYTSESKGLQLGSLFETDSDTFEKIEKVLEGNDTASIKKKDRVYVLPGNNLPKSRIKEYLKSVGAYLTSDITKATVIAGNNNLIEDPDDQAKIATLMFQSNNYRRLDIEGTHSDDAFEKFYSNVEGYTDQTGRIRASDSNCFISNKANNQELYYHSVVERCYGYKYFMYPIAVKVLIETLSKKLSVINQDYFTKHAHSNLSLSDPEVFSSIYGMLDSDDDTNNELGVEVLVHAKVEDTIECKYHLWKLAKEHNWVVKGNRHNKNVKYFLEVSDWDTLNCLYNECYFVKYAHNLDILTSDMFKKLLPAIHKLESEEADTQMYELIQPDNAVDYNQVCYQLKEEWSNYLKEEEYEKITEPI